MELKLTVPTKPSLMQILPALDLLALVFALALILSRFSTVGGYKVELAETTARIPTAEHALVLEVLPGEPIQLWLNREKVQLSELPQRMSTEESKWIYGGSPVILLKLDKSLTQGQAAVVRNILSESQFSVWSVEQYKSP